MLRRADVARQRVVAEALPRLEPHRRVATIGNSSLVTRLLVSARPTSTVVAVEDQGDEGWLLLAELRALGLEAQAASVDDVDADVTVVGCDAIFHDHGFVNRRGTSRLLARMGTRPAGVLGDPLEGSARSRPSALARARALRGRRAGWQHRDSPLTGSSQRRRAALPRHQSR